MLISPSGGGRSPQHTARDACTALPKLPGVYRFRDATGRVMYVGRATDLRSRARSYWGDLSGRRHLRRMVGQISSVEAVVCASVHEAAWLERNLLERSKPRWNRAIGGQEVPRWLVLDSSRDRPGLHLTHEPATDLPTFGPYLGGDRARVAWRGILRAWPVHLTGTRRSGTEHAMAEARGVTIGDRDRLLADIVQLLDREPAALDRIAARLVDARDRAVAGLMFETAQQIHDELIAVAWLVSSQRVTAPHPPALCISGWSAGTLVRFTGTTTCIDRWEVRPVDETRGRMLTAATPPEWRKFAAVNAELAATLRQLQPR